MTPDPPDSALNDRLQSAGLVTSVQLELASAQQRHRGGSLVGIVAELGFADPVALAEFLARESGTDAMDLRGFSPDPAVVRRLPEGFARRLRVLPVRFRDGVLTVATADPFNVLTLDLVRQGAGCAVDAVIAPERDILRALDSLESTGPSIQQSIERLVVDGEPSTPLPMLAMSADSGASAGDAPVIDLVQQMVTRAVELGASDLHLEPAEQMLRLRLRVDGVLRPDVLIPKSLQAAVTARLKLIGEMDVAETRLPQDGRVTLMVNRQPVNLRLSSLPTRFGESVVVRILDPGERFTGLAQLGLGPELEQRLSTVLSAPHGVMLVTGPTGSGKTTTLYAILSEINRPDTGIFTLEDPVEMTLPGIRQTQIREEIGLTFGTALRSLLRQDPDVILVGETRDSETAALMVRAALTGHLVFSTLHTNDAPGAIPRLLDMGVEPCLLPDSLLAVAGQRLVRRLCVHCRRPASRAGGGQVGVPIAHAADRAEIWQATGCPECRDAGFRGRVALFEIMVLDGRFHEPVMRRAPHSEFARLAREGGMATLFEDGWRRVLDGTTTLAEVVQAAGHT